ncbi:ubiquitin-activating enzyme E1 3 [Pyronema domesticum]|uniref:Ubiquitin-activating enzyme E1-like n=1 Tax=Pyronema omphalodes (strain CBS 100304) TaxID=1076935 RepID=U4LB60_PYROM|nr:ubiquitin-activating enzyme E1 3 [Pyronema domesticum]CCX07404.1 Similar to Ubiquitin-activating enzyme E1-like; acc. no. O42939 [Pyronema omphalodes CBS 100304]
MPRDTRVRKSLGTLHTRIKESRVLMVGAGGIGCELLKNLVLTGFGEIHIVDLDTIDLSNLNRQFLFGMQHIKKPKAIVAKETAGKFNPNVKLFAEHANIKDAKFNVKWFKSFNLVFNALDNLDARRHVNRMCLAADVPLIESGTTGYYGQVQVIKGGETECYDCVPKPVPKSFPVCTIRSTPSQPIHCIVWAKSYLFAEVFGTSQESSPELDPSENSENAQEIANLKREAEELKNIREKISSPDFAKCIFEKVFTRDIERLLSMEDMWKTRTPPKPMDYTTVSSSAAHVSGSYLAKDDQRKWNLAENFAVFADSTKRLAKRMLALADGEVLSFDKDDEDTLDFVAAAANLRSILFEIESKSKFDIKQMAGNIIPAIATTNAITAGLCVLQAFKVMRNDLKNAKMVFLNKSTERVITAQNPAPPNKYCEECGVDRVAVEANVEKATLGDVVKKVVRERLGYKGDISITTKGRTLYDSIDFDDDVDSTLKELGFAEETFITVVDEKDDDEEDKEDQEMKDADAQEKGKRVNVVIAISHNPEVDLITTPPPIKIRLAPPKLVEPEPTTSTSATATNGNGKHTIDLDVEEVTEISEVSEGPSFKKRKIEVLGEDKVGPNKMSKKDSSAEGDETVAPLNDTVVVLEDEGVITID